MEDERKAKKQLISEVVEMRQLVATLNATETECRQARAALQESEERFRNLLDYVPEVSIQGYTADGIVRYWNKASEEIYGYTAEEAIGRNLGDLIIPTEVKPHFKQALELGAKCTKSGEFMPPGELMLLHKNGSLVPVYSIHTVVCLSGRPPLMFCIDVDLSERKRTEEALQESEEKFRCLAEQSPNQIFINKKGRIVYANEKCEEMMGYTREEFCSPDFDFLTLIAPEDRALVKANFSRHMEGEDVAPYDYALVAKEGKRIDVILASRLIWYEGERAILGTVTDITDRKRIEAALQRSEERYHALYDLIPLMYFTLDTEGTILTVNQFGLEHLGYEAKELIGKPVVDIFYEPDKKAVMKHFNTFLQNPTQVASWDFRKVHKDGHIIWVQETVRLMRDSNNRDIVLIVCEDITERKRAEEELRKAHNELERRVEERTAELAKVNDKLRRKIEERKQAEESLRISHIEIEQLKDRLQAESEYLRAEINSTHSHGEIVGESEATKRVFVQIEQVAPTESSVLITGETGTGKELTARAIHNLSKHKDRVMVKVDCASLPSALVESELFGRQKGAYTGALTSQVGRFEVADGSSIFLDEIGELSPELQVKLLRVLQEGEFERLGSPKTIRVNVRVIAATNRDLSAEVRKGNFREDLYYRLNVFHIEVPPLRERLDDIPLLVWTFVNEFAEKMGKKIKTVPKKTMDALKRYHWPGNARELRNVIEHAVIISTSDILKVKLPQDPRGVTSRILTLKDAERQHITKVLDRTNWRIKGPHGAAELLGLKPSTLYTKMNKLGIPTSRNKDAIPT